MIRVALVHHDRSYSDNLIAAFGAIGLEDVVGFLDPVSALDFLLTTSDQPEVLITELDFGLGRLHGAALARMIRHRRGKIEAILLGEEEHRSYVADAGSAAGCGGTRVPAADSASATVVPGSGDERALFVMVGDCRPSTPLPPQRKAWMVATSATMTKRAYCPEIASGLLQAIALASRNIL